MILTQVHPRRIENIVSEMVIIFFGSIFLSLMSQIAIPLPFTPVPMTLQTLGVFLLGGTLGARNGALSVVAYLIQGSWGIPVFAGGISNPLWLFDCKAGYLISFVFAAFAIGKLSVKAREHWFSLFMALILGQALIFTVGSLWLSLYIGMKSAVLLGVLPFLSGAGVKILLSAGLLKTNKVEK